MTNGNGRQSTGTQRQHIQAAVAPQVTRSARGALTEAFWAAIATLETIAGSELYAPRDRLRAIDLMGKYGPGTVQGVPMDELRDRLQRQRVVLSELLPTDLATAVHERLREVWR